MTWRFWRTDKKAQFAADQVKRNLTVIRSEEDEPARRLERRKGERRRSGPHDGNWHTPEGQLRMTQHRASTDDLPPSAA